MGGATEGYSRAAVRPCFSASIRLSNVDLVQLPSRGEGLVERRSSAVMVAVAADEMLADSPAAAAARDCIGRSAHELRDSRSSL